ncbi:MAG: PQQ-binding-like beta-propeller repeat protein [Armatimonadota bacterium]
MKDRLGLKLIGPLAATAAVCAGLQGGERPAEGASGPSAAEYQQVEDAAARAALPKYRVIPAAEPHELTPAGDGSDLRNGKDWTRSHGGDAGTRYSTLAQITRENVKELEVAWVYRSGDGAGNIQCNPVIVDGVMYAPTVGEHVVAVNAETGKELWRFKPGGQPAFRGLTYWRGEGGHPSRILFNAGDDLWALDAKTGKPIESFGSGGKARTGHFRVAPAVYRSVIVFAGFHRDVFGYDLHTGKHLWTFNTIPKPGEFGYDTWDQPEEGTNCWGGIALDGKRGIVYVATSPPKPNFDGAGHWGDNLFSNCVLALNAETGKRLWHFQEIRHDIWDLDIPAPPVLVSVERNGKKVDAVATVTKIGNTLLLDRVTGKPLFPFRLRRAPTSKLPGERTSPYQPDVELPQPFARQEFRKEDVTNLSPEARKYISSRLRTARFGWFEPFEAGRPTVFYGVHGGGEWTGASFDPTSGYLFVSSNEVPWIITVVPQTRTVQRDPNRPPTPGETVYRQSCVGCHGEAREGVGVAPPLLALDYRMKDADVSRLLQTGRSGTHPKIELAPAAEKSLLDYLFDRDRPLPALPPGSRPEYTFLGFHRLLDEQGYPGSKPPWGTLNAIDLNTGKIAWKVPLGEHEELTRRGIPKTGTENFGGALSTAGGLVFCAGTKDLKIRAFDSATGRELWARKLPFGGYAPPASYEVNGRQYVVIPATGGGKLGGELGDAYVAFALPNRSKQKDSR